MSDMAYDCTCDIIFSSELKVRALRFYLSKLYHSKEKKDGKNIKEE